MSDHQLSSKALAPTSMPKAGWRSWLRLSLSRWSEGRPMCSAIEELCDHLGVFKR